MRKLEKIVGKSKVNNKGDLMTIIKYNNSRDIDVEFNCGIIVKNRCYKEFLVGTLSKPFNREGESSKTKISGENMKILKYHRYSNIDIIFEDGTIIYGKNYGNFKEGSIKKPESRLGKKFTTNQGTEGEIIAYRSATDIDFLFDSGSIVENITYGNLKKGTIFDPLTPSVFGVGYLGIGDYSRKNSTLCYTKWVSIIRRCYYEGYHANQKCYKDVTVCKEWHDFQNFAKWFQDNYNATTMKGWELDKDIICKDCKQYSPETCCFIPQEINKFFTVKPKKSKLPLGVYKQFNKYKTNISMGKGKRQVTSFDRLEDAILHYNTTKNKYGVTLAEKWKDKISDIIYNKLVSYKLEIID